MLHNSQWLPASAVKAAAVAASLTLGDWITVAVAIADAITAQATDAGSMDRLHRMIWRLFTESFFCARQDHACCQRHASQNN
jgi:hypothetical protein